MQRAQGSSATNKATMDLILTVEAPSTVGVPSPTCRTSSIETMAFRCLHAPPRSTMHRHWVVSKPTKPRRNRILPDTRFQTNHRLSPPWGVGEARTRQVVLPATESRRELNTDGVGTAAGEKSGAAGWGTMAHLPHTVAVGGPAQTVFEKPIEGRAPLHAPGRGKPGPRLSSDGPVTISFAAHAGLSRGRVPGTRQTGPVKGS